MRHSVIAASLHAVGVDVSTLARRLLPTAVTSLFWTRNCGNAATSPEQQLASLGLVEKLPDLPPSVGSFRMLQLEAEEASDMSSQPMALQRRGRHVYVSGHGPFLRLEGSEPQFMTGKLSSGSQEDLERGRLAARLVSHVFWSYAGVGGL